MWSAAFENSNATVVVDGNLLHSKTIVVIAGFSTNQLPPFRLPASRISLVNTFPCELILSFLFSNAPFLYKTLIYIYIYIYPYVSVLNVFFFSSIGNLVERLILWKRRHSKTVALNQPLCVVPCRPRFTKQSFRSKFLKMLLNDDLKEIVFFMYEKIR